MSTNEPVMVTIDSDALFEELEALADRINKLPASARRRFVEDFDAAIERLMADDDLVSVTSDPDNSLGVRVALSDGFREAVAAALGEASTGGGP